MILLKEPGHFVTIVGYDNSKSVIVRDPWPNDPFIKQYEGPYSAKQIPYKDLQKNMYDQYLLI